MGWRERALNVLTYGLLQTPGMSMKLALVSTLIFTGTGKSLFLFLVCTVCVDESLRTLHATPMLPINCTFLEQENIKNMGPGNWTRREQFLFSHL